MSDSKNSTLSIEPLASSFSKPWHSSIDPDLRSLLVGKLAHALFPSSPGPIDAIQDTRIVDLVAYVRKIEKKIFENAKDKEEYLDLLQQKVQKIQEQLIKKKNRQTFLADASPAFITKFQWTVPQKFIDSNMRPTDLSPLFELKNDPSTQLALTFFNGVRNGRVQPSVGVILKGMEKNEKLVNIKLWCHFKGVDGREALCEKREVLAHKFTSINQHWEVQLSQNAYHILDEFNTCNFLIECQIEDLNPIQFGKHVGDPNEMFRQKLWKLYKEKVGLDAAIVVNDKEEFKVHQIILITESDVFKAMLTNPEFYEAKEKAIRIVGFEPEIVEKLIEWMYLGKVEEFEENVEKLFVLADMYGVEQLKDQCAERLSKSLTDQNLVHRLILSIAYSHEMLKEYIVKLMLEKSKEEVLEFFGSPDWIQFSKERKEEAKNVVKIFEDKED